MANQTINLNFTPANFQPCLYFSQGDVGRVFQINLLGIEIPSGATVTMQGTKPSGFGFTVEADSVNDGVALFTSTETMTAEAGRFPAELHIEYDSVKVGMANFLMVGEKNPHPNTTIDGDAEEVIPQLTLLVKRVETAASKVLDMTVVANTLPAGSDATYSYDEETNTATFGIPKGADGSLASGVLAPTYSSSSTYAVGDYVYYSGSLYRCTTAITTAEAWTSGHWTQVALAPEVSDLKSDLTQETNSRTVADNALSARITDNDTDISSLQTNVTNLGTHKVAQPLDGNNQPTNGTSGQLLRTRGNGATEWADVGLPTDEQTAQAVSDWLDEHPEATTTVQDGSLTEAKFSDALKLKAIKDYVTPEMFGAKGDGIADDTNAIQQALNANSNCVLLKAHYLTTNTVTFKGSYRSLIGNGIIEYSGDENALTINGNNLYISINIIALSGNAIKIDATIDNWCQYIKFYDMEVSALHKCVECVRDSTRWVNEIVFNFVRFSGEYGFYFDGDFSNGGYRFTNCSDETCTKSFIYAYNLLEFNIANCRTAEVPWTSDFVTITNRVDEFTISNSIVNVEGIKLPRTRRSLGSVLGGLFDSGSSRLGAMAMCTNGMIVISDYLDKIRLTPTNDEYDFKTATSNILPRCFVLSYVDGGHGYSVNIPYFFYTFPEFYIHTASGLNTLTLKVDDSTVANLSFNGAGYYKLLNINESYVLEKIASV